MNFKTETRPHCIVCVGLGNIGSHSAEMASRIATVGSMILIDPQSFSESNLMGQNITQDCVGKPKVEVMEKRLLAQRNIIIEPYQCPIAEVPLGSIRQADVILACVDSRKARLQINEIAFRLGIPWIDAAVDAKLWVRVRPYVPSLDTPCLECSWGLDEYSRLEDVFPCKKLTRKEQFTPTVASTGAVSEVGAIAASLQTLQARNLLSHTPNLTDQEVFLDLNSHTATCNEYRLNAECRFDHQRYDIQSIETGVNSLSIKQLLNRLSEGESELNTKVGIVGHHFITQLMCAHCCKTLSVTPTLSRGFNRTSKSCPECGGALDFSGFHCLDFLTPNALSETQRDLPLAAFGISDNDILTVKTKTSTSHYQIGASQ